MSLPCSVRDLIPQKGKMGFEQMLIKTKSDNGQSTAIINEGNIFLDDQHQLSNAALIEYVNQLIAAVQGYNATDKNETVKNGLFVGLQDVEFFRPVYLGDSLTIKRYLTEEVAQVNFVQGIIDRDNEKIAEFVTKIYEVKDLEELNLLTNHGRISQHKNDMILNNHQPQFHLSSNMHRKLYSYLHDLIISDDLITFKIACPDDFDAFDGHFPGNPILPGIILLEIAKLTLELYINKSVIIRAIKKMKISGVVLPNQVISCTLKIDKRNDSQLSFLALFKEGEEREISRFSGSCFEGKE